MDSPEIELRELRTITYNNRVDWTRQMVYVQQRELPIEAYTYDEADGLCSTIQQWLDDNEKEGT